MAANFEWQTEEDHEWEQPSFEEQDTAPRSPRRWPWLLLFLAIAIVGAAIGWREVQQRVDEATESVKDDVRSSHSLALQAARQEDEELFTSLLSGRDQEWTEAQQERLQRGLLFGAAGQPFGLSPEAEAAANAEVTLNAELSEAVVQSAQPFDVNGSSGLAHTVHLTQTFVYRQGSRRWLLSPPLADFWGEWRTTDGERLTVVYPQRDEALALRIAQDIDEALVEMCSALVVCGERVSFRLRLEKDPQSVLSAANGEEQLTAGRALTLPAPTLVGLPTDDAAYEALFRGYARHVLATAITELAGYQCCEAALFHQGILELQLAELGLRRRPLRPEHVPYLIDAPPSISHLRSLWREDDPLPPGQEVPPEVYAFLDFIQEVSGVPAGELYGLQRHLSADFDFSEWLRLNSPYRSSDSAQLQRDWQAFLRQMINDAQQDVSLPAGASLPKQDLLALCGDSSLDLYRYDLQSGRWTRELDTGFEFGVHAALPDDDGFIVSGQVPGSDEVSYRTLLKRNGQEALTLTAEDRPGPLLLPWGMAAPDGSRMVVWLFSVDDGESWSPRTALLDPASCREGGCSYETLPGVPLWSPDGSQVIAYDVVEGTTLYQLSRRRLWSSAVQSVDVVDGTKLYRSEFDESQWHPLSFEATWPFWFNDEAFGYVRSAVPSNYQFIMAGELGGREPVQLISTEEMRLSLPDGLRPPRLYLTLVQPHPYDPHALLVVATSNPSTDAKSFLFALRRPPGTVSWMEADPAVSLLEVPEGRARAIWDAPGKTQAAEGRWLIIPMRSENLAEVAVAIYDLQEEVLLLDGGIAGSWDIWSQDSDWSADDGWYARLVRGGIDLIAPGVLVDGRPYRRIIFSRFERCQSLSWING